MTLALAILPLAALILAMTVQAPKLRLPLPAQHALPLAAALAGIVQLIYLNLPGHASGAVIEIYARIVEGLLASLTPLGIVFGAILLFNTLDRAGAMRVLTTQLQRISPHPVAQVMLVGWAFSYLLEGLSGFGTPAALAAPILVGLGFPAVRAAAACLVMNTIPVVFGAVGTPIWFGMGELGLTDDEITNLARRAALIQIAAAPVVALLALAILFPWSTIVRALHYILPVVAAPLAASFAVARFSVEFPSIIGGLAGLAAAIALARTLRAPHQPPHSSPSSPHEPAGPRLSTLRAATPFLLTVALLAATRLEALGLKALLTANSPRAHLNLAPLGDLSLSPSGVIRLEHIFNTDIAWSMPVLYVPFIIPFVLVSLITIPLLRIPAPTVRSVWADTTARLVRPAVALAGALVLVKLLMHGGAQAPVVLIGQHLADVVAMINPDLWPAVAPLLGALGSFFSGSATVSNLTFAPVQLAIAERLDLDTATVLAMQAIGGALGNMVCVHNIVAVAAVLGLIRAAGATTDNDDDARPSDEVAHPVSHILHRTTLPLLAACAASAAALLVL
ncbi:MAG: L-lactate permease [Planctomycetota bacterium]